MLDDAPLNKFHIKITALTFGGNFSDGYALGIIGIALTLFAKQMNLNAVWIGLIGSSALIGLFLGSLVLGWLSDRIGRYKIFIFNFLLITVASFLQFFVDNGVELFILRTIIGIGLGGDYAVGVTLLAEFSPKKYRGHILGSLSALWTFGYVAATLVGFYLEDLGPDAWRWMLASSCIPALIILLLRIGTPESPRWLVSKGRIEEARQIVRKYVGFNVELAENIKELPSNFSALFSKKLGKRTAFSALFYVCLTLPYFAIYTFLPSILAHMGLKEDFMTDLLLNAFLLIGGLLGILFTVKFSRRFFLIGSFVILTISLFSLGVLPSISLSFTIISFIIFTLIMSAVSNLTQVYPSEVFPTEVRSSGVGMATSCSRLGSALGTFLLPISINAFGITVSILALTAVLLIGTIVTIFWAPETKGVSLNESAHDTHDKESAEKNKAIQ